MNTCNVLCELHSGGTIDICVHKVVGRHTVMEKHVASGGNWGGTVVDENFLQIWVDIVGRYMQSSLH